MAGVFSITVEFSIRGLAMADQAPHPQCAPLDLTVPDVGELKPVFSGTVLAICHLAVGDVRSRPAQDNDRLHSKFTKRVGNSPASGVSIE
jgi:hypothetical protein